MLQKLLNMAKGAPVPHYKSTEDLATVTMPLPPKIIMLMQQHIGAACLPTVQKGDTVLVGTVLGRAQGLVGADIHSGVSGKVLGIEKVMMPGGKSEDAVVIEPDGQQSMDPQLATPQIRDKTSFLEAVRAAGLVGLGGAGFPTAVKLAPKNPFGINTLIINAAECEPYISVDNREILECGNTVIAGIMAVKKHLDIARVYIGIERNKPAAMDLMFSLTKGDSSLNVYPLPARYPQGAEKVLIQAITGRSVPSTGLPSDVGVLVLNVTTVSAIGKYLESGLPLMSKRITVDGGAVVEPKNVQVPIGTPIADVIDFCGGYKSPPAKIIVGGPMMGMAMPDTSFPILKQNNAILVLSKDEIDTSTPAPCIRCGRCVGACPVCLSPVEIAEAYDKKDIQRLGTLHASVCMGCGVCSYVCPAKRMLAPATTLARLLYIKEAKK